MDPNLVIKQIEIEKSKGNMILMLSGERPYFAAKDQYGNCLWNYKNMREFHANLVKYMTLKCQSQNTVKNTTQVNDTNCDFKQLNFGIWNFSEIVLCNQNDIN